jgi:ABC-type antimicrobial peptide transport system permease subunit
MIKNYLKIARRHLWKHQRFVWINLTGLGVAIAMCILAYLSWKYDRDFDQFHEHAAHIFRVEANATDGYTYGLSPRPLGEAAEAEIAGVQAGILLDYQSAVVSNGKDTHWERIAYSEADLLKWFTLPLVAGEADLTDPNNILIEETTAVKYFGIDDPVGQTLTVHPGETFRKDFTVVGVIKDLPKNSSLDFSIITHLSNEMNRSGEPILNDDWARITDVTFLVLKDPAQRAAITEYLQSYVPVQNAARNDWQVQHFRLDPFSGMAHHADEVRSNALLSSLPQPMIWGSITMAILLLITACLNFINMTISLAGKRLKEIGLRKVLGSNRSQLIGQLMTEGLILSAGGLLAGLLLIRQILPHYNQMWQFLDLKLTFADNLPLVFFLLTTVILTTVLASAYPAFYVSALAPTKIFRDKVKLAGNNSFSRVLLGAQIAISALAIVSGLSFSRNADFQQHGDLGYQREGIQALFVPTGQSFQVMQQQAEQWPEVRSTAGADFHIGDSCPRIPVKFRGESAEAEWMQVGEHYLETMQINLLAGRTFNYDLASDYEQAALINEQMALDFFPGEDPIGQQITMRDTSRYVIAGVLENFMQDNFFDPTRPLMMTMARPESFQYLVVESQPEDLLAVRSQLEKAWKSNFPALPFEHYFQNDFIANSIQITQNIRQMFTVFSLVTLFLTIAGLFSLLSLSVIKRLKEITIRRILGANSMQIAYLLSSNFLLIVGISLIVGGIGGLAVTKALLDSIFRIHVGVSWSTVIIAAGAIMLIVLFTMAGRLLGAVTGNPVKYLKSE